MYCSMLSLISPRLVILLACVLMHGATGQAPPRDQVYADNEVTGLLQSSSAMVDPSLEQQEDDELDDGPEEAVEEPAIGVVMLREYVKEIHQRSLNEDQERSIKTSGDGAAELATALAWANCFHMMTMIAVAVIIVSLVVLLVILLKEQSMAREHRRKARLIAPMFRDAGLKPLACLDV